MKSDLVEITVRLIRDNANDKAILVEIDKEEKVWLPRSEIEFELVGSQNSQMIRVQMPEWLAIEKGLV